MSFPLTIDGFKVIQSLDSDRKTAFVDGGNQEILGAPNFSVQLNMVYFGMWSGNKSIPEKSIPKTNAWEQKALKESENVKQLKYQLIY